MIPCPGPKGVPGGINGGVLEPGSTGVDGFGWGPTTVEAGMVTVTIGWVPGPTGGAEGGGIVSNVTVAQLGDGTGGGATGCWVENGTITGGFWTEGWKG